MCDPLKKTEQPATEQKPSEEENNQTPDLPEDLKLDPEPEGDIGKLVERGRQMGF